MLRWGFLAVMAALLSLSASARDLFTLQEYRDFVLERAQELYPDKTFRPLGEDTIEYNLEDQDEDIETATIYVNYGYSMYLQSPDTPYDFTDKLLSALISPDEETFEDFRERLIVQLRPEQYFQGMPEGMPAMISRPFLADLHIVLMLDSPDKLQTMTADHLEDFNISEDEAFRLGVENLPKRMGDLYMEEFEGVQMMNSSNGLATALPLYTDACDAESKNWAFWISDRETLLRVEDVDSDPDALIVLAMIQWDMLQNGFGFSDYIFTCLEGEWSSAQPVFDDAE
jgi:hypothetical protein